MTTHVTTKRLSDEIATILSTARREKGANDVIDHIVIPLAAEKEIIDRVKQLEAMANAVDHQRVNRLIRAYRNLEDQAVRLLRDTMGDRSSMYARPYIESLNRSGLIDRDLLPIEGEDTP